MKNNIPKIRFKEFAGEWEEKKLGGIASFKNGKAHEQDISNNGKFIVINSKFISSSGAIRKHSDKQICPVIADDIVMVMSDVPNGRAIAKCFLIDEDNKYTLNQRICALTAKKNVANSEFLNLRVNRNHYFLKFDNGVSQTNLRRDDVLDLKIFAPTLHEQRKIAGFLGAVDGKVEKLEQKKKAFEGFKKGIMQKIFSQRIRFEDENDQDYPDWQEKKLGEIGRIITGKTPSTSSSDYWGGDILFVTPTDITEGIKYQNYSERKVCGESKNILPAGSILYTCIASIGKISLSSVPCITNQQINALIPSKENCGEFIYYLLPYLTPKIKATQANTTLPIINKTEFSNMKITIPKTEEQEKIARFLTEIDNKIDLINNQLEQTRLFKKSLLQRMFV